MILVSHLTKVYGQGENRFMALDDISLEITAGEIVAIVGKSGSGKSTLMHIMSGLDHPTTGSVHVDGVDLFSMKQRSMSAFRAERMSFIFQSFFIEANQTCYQNVLLPLEIAKVPRSDRAPQAAEALAAVGLTDKINTLAGNLSGGQKQRLAIARAVVGKPAILFADEPTGNLDSSTGESIMKLLFNLNKELGCTIIIVTHDRDLAKRCDRSITIKDGRLVK